MALLLSLKFFELAEGELLFELKSENLLILYDESNL